MQFLNRVKVAIATTGTGSVTVGAASGGMLTPAQAGATDGVQSRWILEEGNDWEIFSGTPSSTATVISRDAVEKSFIGGTVGTTKMTLAGAATLRAIASAADLAAKRDLLSANRTYYVRADGNDSNDGLTDSSGGAKLTIQAAIDAAYALDFNGYDVVIQVRTGTFAGAVTLYGRPPGCYNWDQFILRGDTTTPANVAITVTGRAVQTWFDALLQIEGVTITSTVDDVLAAMGAKVNIGTDVVLAGSNNKLYAAAGYINANVGFTVSGNANRLALVETDGAISVVGGTVTLSSVPAFADATLVVGYNSQIDWQPTSISGTATGQKYDMSSGGKIVPASGDVANLANIPGDVQGVMSYSAFSVHKNGTNQTGIADSTFTKVTWSTEDQDVWARFASDAWTPEAVPVEMTARSFVTGTITVGNNLQLNVYKNGVAYRNGGNACGSNFGYAAVDLSYDLADGNAYEIYIYVDLDSGTGTINGGAINTYWNGAVKFMS